MISRSLRHAIKLTIRRIVPSRYVAWSGQPEGNRLAFTFDDGPHPEHTPRVLKVLAEAGVRGTFFVLGSQVERHPAIVEAMIAAGHELGNHTYSHANLGRISWQRGCAELQAAEHVLRAADPRYHGLFRPPWGWMGIGGALYSLRYGYQAAMWSMDSRDYLLDGVEPLIERVETAPLSSGDIILFHDDNAYTAEALGPIIDTLKQRGFSFATVGEILGHELPRPAASLATSER
jgi:peptidoglycan/xylan/chitin deacetylase (PgdA/CDA1 family)